MHKPTIFCKTKKMLKIQGEQLRILAVLVHVKTGAIIVTCSWINKNFLNYAMNNLDKKMLLSKQSITSEKLLMK